MNKPTRPILRQAGFTIVELMVATLIFSIILVVISSGIIHFTHSYYRGVYQSATQTTARDVINTIAQNFQYGGGKDSFTNPPIVGHEGYLCIGSVQIHYNIGAQMGTPDGTYGVLVTSDPVNDCKVYDVSMNSNGKELLGSKMRLTNLSVAPSTGPANTLYGITAGVAYGDLDLLCSHSVSPSNASGGCDENATAFADFITAASQWHNVGSDVSCKPGAGSQFCAFSNLSTQVTSRYAVPSP